MSPIKRRISAQTFRNVFNSSLGAGWSSSRPTLPTRLLNGSWYLLSNCARPGLNVRTVHNSSPKPFPLGSFKDEKMMQKLIKDVANGEVDGRENKVKKGERNGSELHDNAAVETHKDHVKEFTAFAGNENPETGEVGGPKGLEPTRYGDWEKNGRVYDF